MKSWADIVSGDASPTTATHPSNALLSPFSTASITSTQIPTRLHGNKNHGKGSHKFTKDQTNSVKLPLKSPVYLSLPIDDNKISVSTSLHSPILSQASIKSAETLGTLSPLILATTHHSPQRPLPQGAHQGFEPSDHIPAPIQLTSSQHIHDTPVIDTFFGDDHRKKLPLQFRFVFNNKKWPSLDTH